MPRCTRASPTITPPLPATKPSAATRCNAWTFSPPHRPPPHRAPSCCLCTAAALCVATSAAQAARFTTTSCCGRQAAGCSASTSITAWPPSTPGPPRSKTSPAALLWAQSHAAEYGGDPQRIILCGHSAGAAHIAQYLAHPTLRLGNDGVRGAILVSGIYDTVAFGDSPARQAYFGSDRAQIAARSAQAGLLQCGVPLLIAAAELDPPEFRQQAERLGVPHYLLAGHSHISEILAVNTGDTTLSGLMQAFAAQHV